MKSVSAVDLRIANAMVATLAMAIAFAYSNVLDGAAYGDTTTGPCHSFEAARSTGGACTGGPTNCGGSTWVQTTPAYTACLGQPEEPVCTDTKTTLTATRITTDCVTNGMEECGPYGNVTTTYPILDIVNDCSG